MSLRVAMALCVLGLLAACAGTVPVRNKGDAATLGAQEAREHALAGRERWTLQGRLYLSDGKESGSGNLTWHQDGDRYDFTVRGPISGKSFRLSGDAGGALLEGLDGGPQRGPDAESLMARALGWQVPLRDLRAWVLGVRAAGSTADLEFGADRLPSALHQDGWNVEYRAWDAMRQPPLPVKVFADRKPYRVRLVIESWQFD
jgi:outer membrane lipoprotein LolB